MISPEELDRRARKRCQPHRLGVGGYCRKCLLTEAELAIAESHPEMKRGYVFDLVQEWLMQDDESFH